MPRVTQWVRCVGLLGLKPNLIWVRNAALKRHSSTGQVSIRRVQGA